jgi:hypothetical protein
MMSGINITDLGYPVKRKKYSVVKCTQRVAESFVVLRGRAREAGKINASFIYFQIRP